MAADAGEVRHPHVTLPVLVDQGHARVQFVLAGKTLAQSRHELCVDLVDDLEVARQHAAEQRQRPALQRFRQQCVVGVAEAALRDIPGRVPLQCVHVDEQAHQFGDRDRRMGVVQLHREFLVEARQRQVLGAHDAEHVLQRTRHEEVLLLEPQLLALQRLIVGIEDLRDVLGHRLAVHRTEVVAAIEAVEIEGFGCLGPPQPQSVRGVRAVAEDRRVVGDAVDDVRGDPAHAFAAVHIVPALGMSAERDLDGPFRPHELPGVAVTQPAVGLFDLPAVVYFLLEDAVLVADAVTQRRDFQRCQRVDEARGEAAETAVAETGFLFRVQQCIEIEPEFRHRLLRGRQDAQVQQVVAEVRAHQELRREVGDGAHALRRVRGGGADPALQQAVAHDMRKREMVVGPSRQCGKLSLHVEQVVEERPSERILAQSRAVFVRRSGRRSMCRMLLDDVHAAGSAGCPGGGCNKRSCVARRRRTPEIMCSLASAAPALAP